jgi:HEAT repeat protein
MSKNVESSRTEVLQTLHAVLDGENFLSRCTAINAVGRIGGHDAASRRRLIDLLSDPDPTLRIESAAALGHTGSHDAADALLASLTGDPIDEVRTQAAAALSKIGAPNSLESLIDCLANGGYPHLDEHLDEMEFGASWAVRGHALQAVGEIGDPAAVEAVIAFVEDEDNEDLQESGFRVLACLGGAPARAFLLAQLRMGSALAKRRAAKVLSLGESGGAGEQLLPHDMFDALDNALGDGTPAVRMAAARALGGREDSRASSRLIGMLGDGDHEVRNTAAEILGNFGGAETAAHLHPLLEDSDPRRQAPIARILGQIGATISLDPLEALLETDNEELLFEVLGALGNIGGSRKVARIAEILDRDGIGNDLRLQTVHTLERLLRGAASRDKDAVGLVRVILDETLDSEDERVVYAALSALVEIEGARALPRLLSLLQAEPETDETDEPEELEESEEPDAPEEAAIEAAPGGENPEAEAEPGISENSTLGSIQAGFPGLPPAPEADAGAVESALEARRQCEMLRLLAARLLPRLGDVGEEAIEALMAAARVAPADLQRAALSSLAEIGDARALPVLLDGLEADHLETRLAALDGLGRFAGEAAVAARFTELLEDSDPNVRVRAVTAIAGAEGGGVSSCLARALGDEDPGVCRAALRALSRATYASEHGALVLDLLFRFSGEMRLEAARTLRRLDDVAATEALLGKLKAQQNEEQHWICIDALAELLCQETGGDA